MFWVCQYPNLELRVIFKVIYISGWIESHKESIDM